MLNKVIVETLKAHMDPVSRDASYKEFTESSIRYLKNIGLLDCYYDYSTDRDMIYTTEYGRRFVDLNEGNASLDQLRDIIIEDRDLTSERYLEAVRNAVRVNPYRGSPWPTRGSPTCSRPSRSSP